MVKKKISFVFLAIAMMLASFPVFNTKIDAAELPDATQFATVNELKQFNTDDITDNTENVAKVYFGNNKQKWWIAGSENDNVTLFADSPLQNQDAVQFHTDKSTKNYENSNIRNILNTLETNQNYFSEKEQKQMNPTTITTEGSAPITDTLYLANGVLDASYITVGEKDTLHVDNKYWSDSFWLRAPHTLQPSVALLADKLQKFISYDEVIEVYALIPAFELKLSSVLFASAVPTVSKEGALTLENTSGDGAFTLRYQPQSNIGNATYSKTKQSITISEITNDNTYLVVQNKDGAWSKKAKNGDVVFAKEMISSLTSFENCKVWLETTDTTNRMTYASESTQGNHLNVKVNVGEHLSLTNGTQTNVNGTISPITVTVDEGYYLPDDYITNLQAQLNPLTIVPTDNGFTITGTPASDINIILPKATEKAENPNPPTVIAGIGVINQTTSAMEYATSENATTWVTCNEGSTIVTAGTWYIRFKETDTQKASLATSVTVIAPTYTITTSDNTVSFDTKNEGYDTSKLTKNLTITNTGNSKVTLVNPTSSNYDVSLSTNELNPNEETTLSISPKTGLKNGTYNEAIEVKTTENTSVSVNASFSVNGALMISLDASETSIIEGESVTLTASASGGSGNYTYTWYVNDSEDSSLQGNKVTVTPSQTTTYRVMVTDTIENKSAVATITVTSKKYELEVPTDYTFDTQEIGYTNISASSFIIKNTGNVAVSNIKVKLTGKDVDAFTLDVANLQTSLTPNTTTSFVVKPNEDLQAGTYTALVEISGENGIAKSFSIRFTVKEKENIIAPTDPEKPNTDKPSTEKPKKDNASVETGDPTNMTLWITLLGFSSCMLLVSLYCKKKQNK